MKFNFAQVIVENKALQTDKPFTYKIDDSLKGAVKPGMRVVIPFGRGNKNIQGIVVGLLEDHKSDYELKSIVETLDDKPLVSQELLKLAKWISRNYLSSYLEALKLVLPPGNYKTINSFVRLARDLDYSHLLGLDEDQLKILSYLENKDYVLLSQVKLELKIRSLNAKLEGLEAIGYIESWIDVTSRVNKKYEKWVKLSEGNNEGYESLRAKQALVISYLKTGGPSPLKQLMKDLEISSSPVKTLEKKDLIKIEEREVLRNPISDEIKSYGKFRLNKEQDQVYKSIIDSGIRNKFLIHGVTGSGKTEIYLQLVEKMIEEGRDSIVLVPEISLTPQTIDRFVGRFKDQVAVIHSKLSSGERFDQWRMIRDGRVKIVVGARSAIFAPFKNLGLILIDEEHEDSYKSSNNPKYDTIEVAEKRIELEGAKLVLGSATPGMETYYRAREKMDYQLLCLNERINKMMPQVSLVDMREELVQGNRTIFSRQLYEAMVESLDRHKQVILFLNKRGYTSFVSCRTCGYVVRCENCDVSMTYHKTIARLKCHYCGDTKNIPSICPQCGGQHIRHFGIGTEQVETLVKEAFPKARVARMDTDTMARKNSYEKTLDKMKNMEIDILIGTQMIAKGLDFENLTLVGIIAADTSINLPDYRSAERSFQLTTQVAGRAGRSQDQGQVIVQTYNPDHYSLIHAKEHDYLGFYNEEIKIREAFNYPPFKNMVRILVYGPNYNKIRSTIDNLKIIIYRETKRLIGLKDLEIIGPYPAGLEKIKNNYRWHVVLKAQDSQMFLVKDVLRKICLENSESIDLSDIKISIDINPTSMI